VNFQPKDESELKNLLPEAIYNFEVLEASDGVSQKGNDMIKLRVGILSDDYEKVVSSIFDYLLESVAYKLRHFCDAAGLLAKYQAGTLTADDCVGRTGKCKVAIEKDKAGQYADKNIIKDYVCRPAKALQGAAETAKDDLPF